MASLAAGALGAQAPRLLVDLEQRSAQESGNPGPAVVFDDELYFIASDLRHGAELWKTDGSSTGTDFLGDRRPGPDGYGAAILGKIPGALLYWTAVSGGRRVLWRTDGTAPGTVPLRAFDDPGGYGTYRPGIEHEGKLIFFGKDAAHGLELWESDGTRDGTRLLFDLCPGPCHGTGDRSWRLGELILFVAHSTVAFPELWVTDSTFAGTRRLHADCASCWGLFFDVVVAGEQAYFTGYDAVHGSEPWVTDGSEAGTRLVADLVAGSESSWPVRIDEALGSLYIVADGCGDRCAWRTDGTPAGTELVPALSPGNEYPIGISSLGNDLLFATRSYSGESLYRLAPGAASPTLLATGFRRLELGPAIGSRRVFAGENMAAGGEEPWVTDGTSEGTRPLGDLASGPESSFPSSFVAFDDELYFAATGAESGRELWRTDGTPQGTRLASETGVPHASSNPRAFSAVGSHVFFAARADGAAGFWRLDAGGPRRLFEGGLGETIEHAAALPDRVIFASEIPGAAGAADSAGVFSASESDTAAVELARFSDAPTTLVTAGNHVFWGAKDEGQKLYASDGTPAGTGLVFDINPAWSNRPFSYFTGEKLSPQPPDPEVFPRGFTAFAGRLYFAAFASLDAAQLWTSNGTADGTRVVRSFPIPAGPGKSAATEEVREITAAAGRLFFTAFDATAGRELWVTDSAGLGAWPVSDLAPGTASSSPRLLRAAADGVYFFTEEDGGSVLWFSNGTASGTRRVGALLHDGQRARVGERVVVAGNRVYFGATTPATGEELWISDGGAPRLVRELQPGEPGAGLGELSAVGREVIFAASDLESGVELWRSDGTAGGTRRLGDIAPGLGSSSPEKLFRWGQLILFSADDGVNGRELWRVAAPSRGCSAGDGTLCTRDAD